MSNQKVDKFGLILDPIVFVERQLKREKQKYVIFQSLFIILNVIVLLITLSVAIVTPIILSSKNFPLWYILFTAFSSAIGGLITSLINFFKVKPSANSAAKNVLVMQGEIILYASDIEKEGVDKKTQQYKFVKKVMNAIGYAIEEGGDNE